MNTKQANTRHLSTVEPLEQRQLFTAVTFGTPSPYASGGTSIYDAGIGDFNNDGKQDVAVIHKTNNANSKLEWFPGNGQGKLGAPVVLPISQSYVEELAVGDFNGDGRQDLAVTGTGITMYLNNGSGLVQGQTTPVTDAVVSIAAIYAYDTNRQDIAIGNFPNGISIYTLDGTGKPVWKRYFGIAGYPTSLAAGDFNGDKVQDLAITTEPWNGSIQPGSLTTLVGIKDANGKPTGDFNFAPTLAAGSVPGHVVVTNLNGATKNDILFVNEGDSYYGMPGSVTSMIGNGTGSFGSPSQSMVGKRPKMVAPADFGRGTTDYVGADLQDGLVYAKGNGDGTFNTPTKLTQWNGTIGVWSANLNGDGKPDLVVTDNEGNLYTILNTTQPGASITGTVFYDADGDGVKDAGEGAVTGQKVYIDLDNDRILDAGERSTTTDAFGAYLFSGLAAGTYKVRQVLPAGWSQTTPSNGSGISVTLATNQDAIGKNFGARVAAPVGASIAGTIFNDLDGDGSKDTGEGGLSGRTVWLDLDNDKVLDTNEARATTDANGNYKFVGLAAGTYKVRQQLPAGWKQTTPSNGYGINVTLTTNQAVSGKLFGEKLI